MSQPVYSKETRGVRITVSPIFLVEQSSPDEQHYVWAYHVEIANEGSSTVQLMTRCWHITDARGQTQTVRGPGVVGEQPTLHSGETFSYTSGAPLQTPSGFMVGSYEMATAEGERFDADIPAFSLDSPYAPSSVN